MHTLTIQEIRSYIGKRVRYYGHTYIVLEVLEDIPALVIQPTQTDSTIQQDAYGNPRKYSQGTKLIAIFAEDGKTPHSDLAFLEFLDDL
jgi:hypothetical protein